jgi:hypothetical protein
MIVRDDGRLRDGVSRRRALEKADTAPVAEDAAR